MKKIVIGILAHVDAGKTTLSESILYNAGVLRTQGRVDNGDTALDTDALEKERGITIFSSQAVFNHGDYEITLLDTPGHVDFSCETERTLRVIDAAVLVISGLDSVQSHTQTLWKLLEYYNIPVFIFVTKMDYARFSSEEIMENLKQDLSSDCVNFSTEKDNDFYEKVAVCSEFTLNKFLESKEIEAGDLSDLIFTRKLFPCFFGSGLTGEGVNEFLDEMCSLFRPVSYPGTFGARVFKITQDKDVRLSHLKVTGGVLNVKDSLEIDGKTQKVNRLRIYTGSKYDTVNTALPGTVVAVEGLDACHAGSGLGFEDDFETPELEPVMRFGINLPENCVPETFLPMLRQIEEQEPSLSVTWNSFTKEIKVGLMGKVQAEILKSMVQEKFGIDISIGSESVMYKETIASPVEGIGHYEPLRHYAEVHLILEPLPEGSGIKFGNRCSEEMLDRNFQRLILTHLAEKTHSGVLTGSPLTDIKITLAAGRAHLKHTEGGDFRQATYRAVRHALMNAQSVLLEPYYDFTLSVPYDMLGRAISDIKARHGNFEMPEEGNKTAVIKGSAPVVTMSDYSSVVASYTSGTGRLTLNFGGYRKCHNEQEIIDQAGYDPEADTENPADSVFCAHGAGFLVKWRDVPNYMHIGYCLNKDKAEQPKINKRNFVIDDKELEAIMKREFGEVKFDLYRPAAKGKKEGDKDFELKNRQKWIIVDGYNVIFAWDNLKDLAQTSLEAAREKLMQILCNYSAFTGINTVLVFDAYKVSGGQGERFDFHNIHVVYTKEHELGDVYIERLVGEIGKNSKVTVVSSDNLIQLSAVRFGVLRQSAREFEEEIERINEKISEMLDSSH